uniref:Uncharacterized protein n=1 Tax=Oncorhynchus tshawytscha TaxID=74940 RepID=A0AAZ3QQ58_ONCTS
MHVWITEVPYVGTNVLQRLCGSHHCLRHHQRASVQRLRMKRSPKARRQIGADSFQALKNWMKELRQHGPPNIVVAIAGNKCDLSDARLNDSPTQGTSTAEPTVYLQTFGSNNVNIPWNSNCQPLRLSVGDTLEDVYVMSLKHARFD